MNNSDKKKLEKFVVNNGDLESLKEQISSFNFFEAIGAVRQELRHSEFLSFILNPAKKHGLGGIFLKKILKDISFKKGTPGLSAIDIDVMKFEDLDVRREWRNIDILIIDHDENLVVAFENKIDSKESEDQLTTYTDRLYQKFSKNKYTHLKIYLTPDGDDPSHEEWFNYSYEEISGIIQQMIESRKSFLSNEILILLQHYNEMLRRHIVEDSEIIKLCKKIYQEHEEALDLIFEHKPDLQLEIAEYLIEKVRGHGDLILDDSSKSYVRFSHKNWEDYKSQKSGNGWTKSNRLVLFEFKVKHIPNRLPLCLLIGPGKINYRQSILDGLSDNHSNYFERLGKLNKEYNQVFKDGTVDEKTLSDGDFDDIKDKIDSYFNDKISSIMGIIEPILSAEFEKLDKN